MRQSVTEMKESLKNKDLELAQAKNSLSESQLNEKHLQDLLKDRNTSLERLEKTTGDFVEKIKRIELQLSLNKSLIERVEEKSKKATTEIVEKDSIINQLNELRTQQSLQLDQSKEEVKRLTQENQVYLFVIIINCWVFRNISLYIYLFLLVILI